MKHTIKIEKEVYIKFINVYLPVRYEEEDIPNDFPLRIGDMWNATIEIETGKIIDWPQGQTGDMHMKVVDEGFYELLDEDDNVVVSRKGDYVPNKLLPPYDGFGDYVHFKINEQGIITNWYKKPSLLDFED